ncbi:hypothetical protein KR009_011281 [Drosophila setifemur]|nr:hypothetical protein KR009_011281 [Drosophila setifemur]
MAFMMPVMKNNYDIYKDTRSRKTSECSNASSNGTTALATALGSPATASSLQQHQQQQRRRKVSECKSESFATSPSHFGGAGNGSASSHRLQMQRCHSQRAFPRNASRSSQHGSMQQMISPTRDRPGAAAAQQQLQQQQQQQQSGKQQGASVGATATDSSSSSNDYTKFHLRLVDKLRKSFRKDSGKRS